MERKSLKARISAVSGQLAKIENYFGNETSMNVSEYVKTVLEHSMTVDVEAILAPGGKAQRCISRKCTGLHRNDCHLPSVICNLSS